MTGHNSEGVFVAGSLQGAVIQVECWVTNQSFFVKCSVLPNFYSVLAVRGHPVAHLVQALRYQAERSRVRFPILSLEFFIDIILPVAL